MCARRAPLPHVRAATGVDRNRLPLRGKRTSPSVSGLVLDGGSEGGEDASVDRNGDAGEVGGAWGSEEGD